MSPRTNNLIEPGTAVSDSPTAPTTIYQMDEHGDGLIVIFNHDGADDIGFRYGTPGAAFANYTPIGPKQSVTIPVTEGPLHLLVGVGTAANASVIHIPTETVRRSGYGCACK
jgi:hypothetical protein